MNGPSLVRVPDWIDSPLRRYELAFAHYRDAFIRLARTDAPEGRWHVHRPGSVRLEDTPCLDHAASPDVHGLDDDGAVHLVYAVAGEHGLAIARLRIDG